jgi:anti-sigma factor RsiW
MRCRHVERWLALGRNGAVDDGVLDAVRAHLEACPRCASIEKELDVVRRALAGSVPSGPPAALFEATRRLCLERLAASEAAPARPVAGLNGALRRVPPAVWAALIGLLLTTAFILAPFFGEALRSEPLSYASWVGLGFLVQNAFMLFFSPLLLRRRRRAEACA